MTKSTLLALSLAVGFSVSAEMNLKDAIKSAVKTHPTVKAQQASVDAAGHRVDQAKSGYLPSLDLRIAGGMEQSENTSVIAEGDQHKDLRRFESSLKLTQNLYTGGALTSGVDQANATLAEQSYRLISAADSVVLKAIEAYLGVLRNQELIAISQENVVAHKEILETTEQRHKEGLARKSDIIQVKGRLALAKAQLQRELANKAAVSARFIEAIGVQADGLATAPSQAGLLPAELTSAQTAAIATHPELKAFAKSFERAQAAVKAAKAAYQPNLVLEVSADENDGLSGVEGNNDSYKAMAVTNWNLFKGGADKANVNSLSSEAQQVSKQAEARSREIKRDVAIAWYDRDASLVELNYFTNHLATVKNTLEAYTEQYKLGKRTLFDLLNSREELFQASGRVIETSYTTQQSTYNILAEMGTLSTTLTAEEAPKVVAAPVVKETPKAEAKVEAVVVPAVEEAPKAEVVVAPIVKEAPKAKALVVGNDTPISNTATATEEEYKKAAASVEEAKKAEAMRKAAAEKEAARLQKEAEAKKAELAKIAASETEAAKEAAKVVVAKPVEKAPVLKGEKLDVAIPNGDTPVDAYN